MGCGLYLCLKLTLNGKNISPILCFRLAHVLDWANEHLLISPFGLPVLITTFLTIYRFRLTIFEQPADKDYAHFLGLTAQRIYCLPGSGIRIMADAKIGICLRRRLLSIPCWPAIYWFA